MCYSPPPLYLSNWYQMDDGKDFEEEDVFGMDPQTAEQQEAVKKQLASKVGCRIEFQTLL